MHAQEVYTVASLYWDELVVAHRPTPVALISRQKQNLIELVCNKLIYMYAIFTFDLMETQLICREIGLQNLTLS